MTRLAWRLRLLGDRRSSTGCGRGRVPIVTWVGPGSLDDVLQQLQRQARAPGWCAGDRAARTLRAAIAAGGQLGSSALGHRRARYRGGDGDGHRRRDRTADRPDPSLLVLTLAAAAVPDSVFPAGVVVAVAVLWGSTVPHAGPARRPRSGPRRRAAAPGTPPRGDRLDRVASGAPIPAAARRRWLGQGLVVAAGTAATTALGGLLLDARLPGTALVSIAALVAIAGAGLRHTSLSTR